MFIVQSILEDGFLRGFFVGQFVSFLIVLFLVKHFFLASGPPAYISIKPRPRKLPADPKTVDVASSSASMDALLLRLGIDHKKELDESCGWLNLLLARLIFGQLVEDEEILQKAIEKLEETVSSLSPFIKGFAVKHAEVTPDQVLRLDGFRLKRFFGAAQTLEGSPSTFCLEGRLRWENAGRFEIEAAPAFTWPLDAASPLVMLPCLLGVRIISVDAVVRIAFPDQHVRHLEISLVPDAYSMELEVESSIGAKAKLRNAEQVSRAIGLVLRKTLEDTLVWPNRVLVEVPKLSDLIV